MQASIIRCMFKARKNWEGCARKSILRKKWEDDGRGDNDSPYGWRPDGLSLRLPLLFFPAL